MLKKLFSNRRRGTRQISAVIVILAIAGIGTALLLGSHAASPFASSNADKGSLAGGALKQTCSGSADGSCVTFAGQSSAGGGSSMIVGLNGGGWGLSGAPSATDLSKVVKYVRYDADSLTEPISDFSSNGVKVDVVFSGPYTTSGVSSINASSWANSSLSWYQTNCTTTACPMIEILNEPGGNWYWGASAMSTTNAKAYATLVKTTYTTFHNAYGANAPLILASYDGGSAGDDTWGQEVWAADPTVANYVDGVIIHPYGNTGDRTQSALGSRASVTDAHTQTGKPVYVTEVGWPTAVNQPNTGDSFQWSEAEQCNNIYNFIGWARGTGYVNAVIIFGYVDYGTSNFYGILRWDNPAGANGSQKPSYAGLQAAAQNHANPCPAS